MSSEPNDKRSVSTDALGTLGTIHDRTEKRDAIHLAVEPVTAGEKLRPGEHIDVTNGVATGTLPGKGLGIVDPFLLDHVRPGQRFWFVMYPRAIHSLRHVWTHPAFPDEPGVHAPSKPSKTDSEAWLRAWCDDPSHDAPPYDDLIDAALRNDDDEYLYFGTDAHGEIPAEVWDHIETVTGRTGLTRAKYFSCAC